MKLILLICILAALSGAARGMAGENIEYPVHRGIASTVFWVGEKASKENEFIPNKKSVWDYRWMKHFGGVDDPGHRNGYFPAEFQPKENAFYLALPYNDFDGQIRRPDAIRHVYWAALKKWGDRESMCKNRWVKVMKDDKTAYVQWQDAGPYGEDDHEYVFGTQLPKNPRPDKAGIDLSPATAAFLGLKGIDSVDWQFVDDHEVPDGPWKKTVTTSQVCWE